MCGITGFWRMDASPNDDRAHLRAMMDTLVHRGPDGDGMHLDGPAGLAMGHTRLAIIDLHGGAQPLYSTDRSCVLTLNGELYDHEAHRARLIADGARFETETDAEIALHHHERRGLDFVHQLRGEFAFALYDGTRERLVLVRDRFGVKPLYFTTRDGDLWWGSEVKAILAHPRIEARLDPRAVLHQMMQVMVPGTTAFDGIRALRPGHMLVAQRVGNRLQLETSRWWHASFPQATDHEDGAAAQPWIEGIRERLIDAVRVRLRADVPVGCYLSGGLDSASVLGLASTIHHDPIDAFTIAFENEAYDESQFAAVTARRAGIDPTVLRLGAPMLYGRSYERAVWHAERTFYNTLGVAKWHMSRAAHQHGAKAVLTGEGADELFAGYPFFMRDHLLHGVHGARREQLMRQLEARNPALARTILATQQHEHPALNDQVGFTPSWIHPWIATLARVRPLLSPSLREQLEDYDPIEAIARALDPDALRGRHPLDKAQYTWIQTMLEGQLLGWGGDRVDMANSIESRPPFLDHQLAEYAFGVPPSLRLRDAREKWVLREAVRHVLPPMLYEREKFAFMAPPATARHEEWAEISPLVERHLGRDALELTGLFDVDAVTHFLGRLTRGDGPSSQPIGDDVVLNHLLGLQLLHRYFIQGHGRPAI